MASEYNRFSFRTQVLNRHLNPSSPSSTYLSFSPCLSFTPPELSEPAPVFGTAEMRSLVDGHNIVDRDWLFNLIIQNRNNLFNLKKRGHRSFVSPDYNQSMEQQRAMTMKRIEYFLGRGVYKGWLTANGPEAELRKLACFEVFAVYDHSLVTKLGVHFYLWYV